LSQFFTDTQLESIAAALGDTASGLTGAEIGFLLQASKIVDVDQTATKRVRLYNAFAANQNSLQQRSNILAFIRKAMKPERYVRAPERFETLRSNLNSALVFAGIEVDVTGALQSVNRAKTVVEARARAAELRVDLIKRGVHEDVLKFCKAELLADNYFHAVMEAVKSVMDKLRTKSGLDCDGMSLIDRSLLGDSPIVRINSLVTESERSEQKGFAHLLKGITGMFRNTTAHEARVHWVMSKDDAEDLLSTASLIHRRLDKARTPSGTSTW
jgi:uncharacterized protein (TIGR02391 family)